jgi:hypothetical protein
MGPGNEKRRPLLILAFAVENTGTRWYGMRVMLPVGRDPAQYPRRVSSGVSDRIRTYGTTAPNQPTDAPPNGDASDSPLSIIHPFGVFTMGRTKLCPVRSIARGDRPARIVAVVPAKPCLRTADCPIGPRAASVSEVLTLAAHFAGVRLNRRQPGAILPLADESGAVDVATGRAVPHAVWTCALGDARRVAILRTKHAASRQSYLGRTRDRVRDGYYAGRK